MVSFALKTNNMITILHNPRCGKSRTGLQLLDQFQEEVVVRRYLDEPLSKEEIIDLLQKLNKKPKDIIRTQEKIWKENFAKKTLSDAELISILAEHPILIERPIVIRNEKAIVGRPPENILQLI